MESSEHNEIIPNKNQKMTRYQMQDIKIDRVMNMFVFKNVFVESLSQFGERSQGIIAFEFRS